MFNFLNPTVLFGLIAGLIPLLIHLLNRKKFREIPFSTVHFLKQMSRKEMRRLKIRQILLLIIRTLMILLLVLAFARPTLKTGGQLWAGRSSVEMVFILDNSLSMNRLEVTGNLLEKVRETWLNLETVVHPGDRVSVITMGAPPSVLASRKPYSTGLWKQIASVIQPGALRGDLYQAILQAVQLLRQSPIYRKEIYIVSDFQKTNISQDRIHTLLSALNFPVHYYLIPITTSPVEDVSVDSVEIVNRLIEKDQELQVQAIVTNNHPDQYLTSLVSLILKGVRVARQNISLPPGERKLVDFRFVLQQTGWVDGFVECESDMLAENNRYYFNFYVPDKIQLLHLVPADTFRSFVPIVLKPAIDKNIFIYQKANSFNWVKVNFTRFQVVVLEGFDRIPDGLALRLEQFVHSGGGLWIIPGEHVIPSEWNRFLKKIGMGQFLTIVGQPGDTRQFLTQGKIRWNHPVFERLFEKSASLRPIQFYAYYQYKPSSAEEILIPLENDDPLLSVRFGKQENVALLTVPLQPAWTNLLYRGFVVPLSYRLLYYAVVHHYPAAVSIRTGEKFTYQFEHLPAPYQFMVRTPANITRKIVPVFRGNRLQLTVEENNLPGNYFILQGNKTIGVYSVNPDAAESRQQFATKQELLSLFPDGLWLPPGQDLLEKVEQTRFGKELWPYLLGMVLLLLLAEMVLAFTGSRKRAIAMQEELARS